MSAPPHLPSPPHPPSPLPSPHPALPDRQLAAPEVVLVGEAAAAAPPTSVNAVDFRFTMLFISLQPSVIRGEA